MKRLCLFAGYDETGIIDDYVVHYIKALSEYCDVYYFADNECPVWELRKLEPFTKGRWASRHGRYDFGSWQKLIYILGWNRLSEYDSVLLVNDSNYGPLFNILAVFAEMEVRPVDFWGITQNNGHYPHLQSYFIALNRKVVASDSFRNFFETVTACATKAEICIKYEIGLSKLLCTSGMICDTYIDRNTLPIQYGDDISQFQNSLIKAGSPFIKRKVFSTLGFALEDLSETREWLARSEYPIALICWDQKNQENWNQKSQDSAIAAQAEMPDSSQPAMKIPTDGCVRGRFSSFFNAISRSLWMHDQNRDLVAQLTDRLNALISSGVIEGINTKQKLFRIENSIISIAESFHAQVERTYVGLATTLRSFERLARLNEMRIIAYNENLASRLDDQTALITALSSKIDAQADRLADLSNTLADQITLSHRLHDKVDAQAGRLADLSNTLADQITLSHRLHDKVGAQAGRLADLLNTLADRERSFAELHCHIDWVQRDILIAMKNRIDFGRTSEFTCVTDHPIAYDSPDHLHPVGTLLDHTRHPRFIRACEDYFGKKRGLSFLDLGCSAGGIVWDAILRGHVGVGLEGSDLSKLRQRAEWRLLAENLFTCDISRPFQLLKKGVGPHAFDVISAWEVLEHLTKEGVNGLFSNLSAHSRPGSLFVCSISQVNGGFTDAGAPLHQTLEPLHWWLEAAAAHGFGPLDSNIISRLDFARGNGNPSVYYRPENSYRENPGDCLLVLFERK